MNNLYQKLIDLEATDKERVNKAKDLDVLEIESGKEGVYTGIVLSNDRTYTQMIEIPTGECMCSCQDFQCRKVLCKHLIAFINHLDREIKDDFLHRLVTVKRLELE